MVKKAINLSNPDLVRLFVSTDDYFRGQRRLEVFLECADIIKVPEEFREGVAKKLLECRLDAAR